MTKKLPYTHEACSGQVRFLDSSDILFHFSLVLFTLILSHIIATRVGLDLSCMTCILKYSLTSAIKWLATKKDLGPFKIDRAVVDSNRSVNLPFDIRKILCTYPRKRKDIRGLQMFLLSDRRPVIVPRLEGWLASGEEICLYRGRVVEKTRLLKHFDEQFYLNYKFNLFKFTADPVGKGPHFYLTLDKLTLRLIVQLLCYLVSLLPCNHSAGFDHLAQLADNSLSQLWSICHILYVRT